MLVMNTRKPGRGAGKPAPKGRTTGSGPSKPRTARSSDPKKPFNSKAPKAPATPEDETRKPHFPPKVRKGDPLPSFNEDEIRLNKYLSNAGVCSRREADVLIQTGVVTINGVVV